MSVDMLIKNEVENNEEIYKSDCFAYRGVREISGLINCNALEDGAVKNCVDCKFYKNNMDWVNE